MYKDDLNVPDVLKEFEQEINLVPASSGQRLVNFIVDMLLFNCLSAGVGIVIGLMLAASNATGEQVDTESDAMQLFFSILTLILALAYYTLFEGAKGRTPGKMATGTIVVKENGNPITYKDALLRSLCRFVPFEFISILFGRPWHDTWTKTMVVKKTN